MIRVVGTAGHVDHGKSALVEALTGTHPDRLREEREREMTIDLGFAWMELPGGIEVGFIDVPGHRDFIDNMLAGVGGFDAAMLVVAADEGVMPQTREHLAILDLLRIPRLLVVLNKVDLVDDPDWLPLVEADLRTTIGPTAYREAPILRVSAVTGVGLDALKSALEAILREAPARLDRARPRLPVDRAFSMTGFGTVLTGTLLDGSLGIGDEVVVLPAGIPGRIRGLQTHRRKVERALPGSRVAANVTGIDLTLVKRGDVVCAPGGYSATRLIDARVRVLADAPVGLRHDQSLKLHVGAADVLARARVLVADEVRPGEEGWIQLVLESPIVTADGDRFILRRPAPPSTLAGGQVVNAHPARVHRRRDPEIVESLERRLGGTLSDRLLDEVRRAGPVGPRELERTLEIGAEPVAAGLRDLESQGLIRRLRGGEPALYVEAGWWQGLVQRSRAVLEEFHAKYPLRGGMPREDFRRRINLDSRTADGVLGSLAKEGVVEVDGPRIRLAGFRPKLDPMTGRAAEELARRFEQSPYAPPSIHDCVEAVGHEAWTLMVDEGKYVPVAEDVAFAAPVYRRLVAEIGGALEAGQVVTVAHVRDRYATSRKYALALLEHLDRIGVSVRIGDERRRGAAPLPDA